MGVVVDVVGMGIRAESGNGVGKDVELLRDRGGVREGNPQPFAEGAKGWPPE